MPSAIDDKHSSQHPSTPRQRIHGKRNKQHFVDEPHALGAHGPVRPPSLALVPAPGHSPGGRPYRSSSGALLSLSQDVTALVSLSVESTASLVNDYVRSALGVIGMGQRAIAPPSSSGHGGAVVVVGAADPSGQSLTLRLAKSGYTVFPFMPIAAAPTTGSTPVSAPLSALLLAWSGVQKRLQARDPAHSGAVVPVVIDDTGDAYLSAQTYPHSSFPPSPPKRGGRFAHAGDTVRHYCRENGLTLVAVVCAAPTSPHSPGSPSPLAISPRRDPLLPGVTSSGLANTDEEALMALYRAHVLDPISVIRALGDMLAAPPGGSRAHGRVLFVESTGTIDDPDTGIVYSSHGGAGRMIAAARAETARLLRVELSSAGIDVCEIAVGPMAPRLVGQIPLRSSSCDSDTDRALAATTAELSGKAVVPRDDALATRLRLLVRIFAVDDALVYSCVRRAIEDKYPRARHNAGLSPLISSVVNATPGAGVVRFLGRWVLGRLFARQPQA